MPITGSAMPAIQTRGPGASAPRPARAARSAIQAPASPPATASGGSTNTKCRMPLYIAGRAITVTAIGRSAASAMQSRIARAAAAMCGASTRRTAPMLAPSSASSEEDLRQLEAEQHRHIAARHVGRRDQLAAEHLVPRLLEEVREISRSRAKRIERIDHRPGPDQRHHRIGEQRGRQQRETKTPSRCSALAAIHRRALRSATSKRERRDRRKRRRSPP